MNEERSIHCRLARAPQNAAGALAMIGLALSLVSVGEAVAQAKAAAPEVVVYAADLPASALSEFDVSNDPAAAGGKMVATPNGGGDLDPPPENDPHVIFKVRVQSGVPYRCWVRMKVGKPKGVSTANLFFVQFSDAVDQANKPVFAPGSASYLPVRGPGAEGWFWTGGDPTGPKVSFGTSGEVTVRMQAGMEGVGFDQFVLSPARYLEKPPTEAVVAKSK